MNKNEQRGVRAFCRMLGEKSQLSFVIGADCPATDGRTVFLPSLDNLQKKEVLGFTFHEAQHILFTSFNELVGLERVPAEIRALFKEISNALEDTRIEVLGTARFPGGQSLLNGRLKEQPDRIAKIAKRNPATGLITWICVHGKVKFLQSPLWLAQELDRGRKALDKALGATLMAKVESLAEKVAACGSTAEVIELATKIANEIKSAAKSAAEKAAQQPDQNQSGSSSDQDEGQGQPQSDASSSEQGEEQSGASSEQGIAKALEKVLKGKGKNLAENAIGGQGTKHGFRPDVDEAQSWVTNPRLMEPTARDLSTGDQLVSAAKADANAVRSVLTGLLQTRAHTSAYLAQAGKHLSAPHLARLAVGNLAVFERRNAPKVGFDSAVEVIVDRSGSMDRELESALRAGLAVTMAVKATPGCSAELAVFPCSNIGIEASEKNSSGSLVGWEKGITPLAKGRIGKASTAYGGTYIVPCLRSALNRLIDRPESRKIVLVLTDGLICGSREEIAELKQRMDALGVRCYFITVSNESQHTPTKEQVLLARASEHVQLAGKDETFRNMRNAFARLSKAGMFE